MKRIKIIACLLCLSVLLGSCVTFSASAEENTLSRATVTGCGKVSAAADAATVRFETLSYSATLAKAQKQSREQSATLVSALSQYGSLTEDAFFTSEGMSGTRFLVTTCYSLTTDRIQELDAILEVLKELGASAVLGVCYTCRDVSLLEQEAFRLAVADAQQKAVAAGISLPLREILDRGCYDAAFCYENVDPTSATVTVECRVELVYGAPRGE